MYKELIEKLKKFNTIGVFSHVRPDGDCIGSQIAVCRWLEKKGFTAFAFNDDDLPMNLQWMTDFYPIRKPDAALTDQCDLFILVDGNAPHRFGSYTDWQDRKERPVFMIDHHPDPEDVFDISISVVKASSTCELIYNLISEDDINRIDVETAKALYTGIITDTGSLQFDSVSAETLEIAADLLRIGQFKPNEVAEKVFSNQTKPQLLLLSRALATIELFADNQIAVMSVTETMFDETETNNSDTGGLVNYPLSITGIKAAVLFKDLGEDGIKMSLRSKSEVDVNVWARQLGGGGHKKAAGAWHKGPLKTAIEETVKIGEKQL